MSSAPGSGPADLLLTAARLARRGGGGRMEAPPPSCQAPPPVSALARALRLQCPRESAPAGRREECSRVRGGQTGGSVGERETGVDRGTAPPGLAVGVVQTGAPADDRGTEGDRRSGLGRQAGTVRQTAVVSVRLSGCRRTWRLAGRCRASMLPVIAEGP